MVLVANMAHTYVLWSYWSWPNAAQQRLQVALVLIDNCDIGILVRCLFSLFRLSHLCIDFGSKTKIRDIPIHDHSIHLGV